MRAAAIEPVALAAKEGLALINGTDGMLACSCSPPRPQRLLQTADLTAAMSVEALLGTDQAFAAGPARAAPPARPAKRRQHAHAAGRLGDRRQPPPQRPRGAGRLLAALRAPGQRRGRDTLAHAQTSPPTSSPRRSTTRGPPRRPRGVLRQLPRRPLGLRLDFLAIAIADVGAIAERRTDRLLDAGRSHGLPPFLADDPGVDSGLMIAQYTQAALVAETDAGAPRRA